MAVNIMLVVNSTLQFEDIVQSLIDFGICPSSMSIHTYNPKDMWRIFFREPENGTDRTLSVFPRGSCKCDYRELKFGDGTLFLLGANDFSLSLFKHMASSVEVNYAIDDERNDKGWVLNMPL